MPIGSSPRLAVLIDAENAPPSLAPAALTKIKTLGTPILRRAYGNLKSLCTWEATTAEHSIDMCATASGKNAADIALAIDAMDLLYSGRYTGFCIISRDRDFTRLATRIRAQGLAVHGFAHATAPATLAAAYDSFTVITAETAPCPKPTAPPINIPPARLTPTLDDVLRVAMGNTLYAPKGQSLSALGDALARLGYKPGSFGTGTLRNVIGRSPEFEVIGQHPHNRVRLKRLPPRLIAAE